jgi:hypothetical protein
MFNDHYPDVTGKILPVTKLYYAGTNGNPGYPFKIVFKRCKTKYWRTYNIFYSEGKINRNRGQKPTPIPELIDMETQLSAWLRGKYNKFPFHSEYKERFFTTRTIFLEKYEDWKYLVERFGKYIITAERPINNTHWALLTSGEKLIFRKSLFWRKYRYKIGFKSTPELYQNGLKWIECFFENKTDDEYRFNHNILSALRGLDRNPGQSRAALAGRGRYLSPSYKQRYYYYGHNIFINSKEDIVMLKLGMNHSIHSIEQCMTYNEVENFEKELKIEN